PVRIPRRGRDSSGLNPPESGEMRLGPRGHSVTTLSTARLPQHRTFALDARAAHVADAGTSAENHEPTGTRPFAAFEWMLSLRYLRARRKEGFISVIAGFSFLGILLGVATLIVVLAVMNGFRKELLD